jgi:hypothetical protein
MAVRVHPAILVVRIWEPGKKSSMLPLLRQTSIPGFVAAEPGLPPEDRHPALTRSGRAINCSIRPRISRKSSLGTATSATLEHHAPRMPDHLGPHLDQLLLQGR